MVPGLSLEHIIILGVIALVVVGPKDLPLLLRKLGKWTARLRGMAQEFRTGFDELARQAELDELKREVEALRRTTNLTDISKEISRPLGTLESYAGISPPPAPPESLPLEGGGAAGEGVSAVSSATGAASSTPHPLPPPPPGEGETERAETTQEVREPRVAQSAP